MATESEKNISRRNFIKASAITVVSAAGTNALAVEATSKAPVIKESRAGVTSSGRVVGYCGEGDWLGAAPAIPDADIANTVNVDVLVLGGGHAGLLATLGASDNGAKVAVAEIQAKEAFNFVKDYNGRPGEDIGHVNSQWLINRGYGPYNTGEIVGEFVKRAGGRCNPDIIRLFAENSGAMFDRMVEVYEEYKDLRKTNDSKVEFKYSDGTTAIYDFFNIMGEDMVINQAQKGINKKDYPIEIGGYKTWPCNAQFMGPILHRGVQGKVSVLYWFEKYIVQKTIDQGADWYYETKAVVLTQYASGAVSGAIVQDAAGKYIKFKTRKGVILATGGFHGNPDMSWALLNENQEWAERNGSTKEKLMASVTHDGQGHKMACWAGGMIEPAPRGAIGGPGGGVVCPWGVGPMLQLNAKAKRFCNEAAVPLADQAAIRQPKGIICVVTDKKYMKSVLLAGVEHGGPNYGRPVYYEDLEEDMKKVAGTGAKGTTEVRNCTVAERQRGSTVYGADTLEELAAYLGYEGDLIKTFVESIKKYNEQCYAGVDNDFGKEARVMIPVDEPPFYGVKSQIGGKRVSASLGGMSSLAGLISDERLRVLDKEGQPIKGLFVCGNTLGGRYGLGYSTPFAGNSIGMAMTHGWLAGRFATAI
jgi:hypothetical protein